MNLNRVKGAQESSKLQFSAMFSAHFHCVKSACIRSYSGPHFSWIFPVFGLNTERYSVQIRENTAGQSNSEYGHFLRSAFRYSRKKEWKELMFELVNNFKTFFWRRCWCFCAWLWSNKKAAIKCINEQNGK